MKLFTNGFPKSGNHALLKACELLGQSSRINHVYDKRGLPAGTTHHIFIKRDPRNVIISKARGTGMEVTPELFLLHFRNFESGTGSKSFIEEIAPFEHWLTDSEIHLVKYEDLIVSNQTMHGIADYLGVPYVDGAFGQLDGLTMTWNKVKSDYHKIWSPEVESAFYTEGGRELLERWGYG